MDQQHLLTVIAVLLALILAAMLGGAENLKNILPWIFPVWIGGAIVYGIALAMRESFREAVEKAKEDGLAWRWKFFLWPGLTGCILVYALAWISAGTIEGEKFGAALGGIPYWGAPFYLVAFAFVVRVIESAPRLTREGIAAAKSAPGATIGFLNRWAFTFVAPVTYPRDRWTEIKTQRLSGQAVGSFSATGSVFWSFLAGCAQFIAGWTLLLFVVFLILKAVGAI